MDRNVIGLLIMLVISMGGNLYFAFSPAYNQLEVEVDPVEAALNKQAWDYYAEALFNVHYHYRMKNHKLRDAYQALVADIKPYVGRLDVPADENEHLPVTEEATDRWYLAFDRLRVAEATQLVNMEVAKEAQADVYWEIYGTRDWKEGHRIAAERK